MIMRDTEQSRGVIELWLSESLWALVTWVAEQGFVKDVCVTVNNMFNKAIKAPTDCRAKAHACTETHVYRRGWDLKRKLKNRAAPTMNKIIWAMKQDLSASTAAFSNIYVLFYLDIYLFIYLSSIDVFIDLKWLSVEGIL